MGGCGQSSHWRILKISFPPLRLYGVCGAKICLKTTDPGLVSILTAQNYCNSSKLPSFLIVNLYCFHTKSQFYPPPILICVNLLVLFVRQTWNSNNAILVGKASFLLPSSCCRLPFVSSDLLCPLLSYSLSSVSLRDFFGMAHLTVAGQATSSYRNVLLLFFLVMPKLERARFYAWLIESVVTQVSHVSSTRPEKGRSS